MSRIFTRFLAVLALVAGVGAAMPAQAQVDRDGLQRWINVVNRSSVTIREFYMTDVDTNGWGDDRLGRDVIPPGQAYRALPTNRQRQRGYCRFDMRVVFENGAATERRGVNLCEVASLVCTSTSNCVPQR
jgi:hypothetical protein